MKGFIAGAFLAITFMAAGWANAGDCCCEHCGCDSQCQKVCHRICEMKKVTEYVYDCRCEDICVPKGHCHHEQYECSCEKNVVGETRIRSRAKLYKHAEVKMVPTYKWVVENLCDHCACNCAHDDAPEAPAVKSAGDEPTPAPLAPGLSQTKSHDAQGVAEKSGVSKLVGRLFVYQ